MNNLSNDKISTIKQLVDNKLFSFIANNAKAQPYEINSDLKNIQNR